MHINSAKNAHSWESFRITFVSRNKEMIGSNLFCCTVASLEDVIGHMISEGTGLTRPQAMAYFDTCLLF